MSRILITAGPVYGKLDDNKLVSNRVRGVWAVNFADWLNGRGHTVDLLVADTARASVEVIRSHAKPVHVAPISEFSSYESYSRMCLEMVDRKDAAVMAAAVVNWIPAHPINGKMATKNPDGSAIPEGTILNVPFVLAPRVIDRMKAKNPHLTLIGCKMTIGETKEHMVDLAIGTLRGAKCAAVVANDMGSGLRMKYIVHPDHAVLPFDVKEDPESFYLYLEAMILDEHFSTEFHAPPITTDRIYRRVAAGHIFDKIVNRHRADFFSSHGQVFGSVAVPVEPGEILASPREKSKAFTAKDAVFVSWGRRQNMISVDSNGDKATMNVVLLHRMLDLHREAHGIVHLHRYLDGAPFVPYAPPGTVRDNRRELPVLKERVFSPAFNIQGHGLVAAVGYDGEFLDPFRGQNLHEIRY